MPSATLLRHAQLLCDTLLCYADDPGEPTKGELAKAVRLLIANARDDEQLYHSLGRHW